MGKRVNKELAFKLHSDGLTIREIANKLDFDRSTIQAFLSRHGLKINKESKSKLIIIDDTHLKCTECGEIKDINDFHYNSHKKMNIGYRLSFCRICAEKKRKNRVYNNLETYLRDKFLRTKTSSKSKNIPFTIDNSFLLKQWNRQDGKCFYMDTPLIFSKENNRFDNRPSIDKIIPELGYVDGNIVICSQRANQIKSNLTLEELEIFIPTFYIRIQKHLSGE